MKLKSTTCCIIILLLVLSIFTIPTKVYSKDQKLIYLTFDDGPGYNVTENILDILKSENVKATFFVIGSKIPGRESTLNRMKSEGHSIGLHTYSHEYRKIYKNNESFINEMNAAGNTIKNVTGISSKIIRFPSGSNGHMNEALLNELHSMNYKVFDWNLCLSDGINHNTPVSKLYREGTEKCVNPSRIFLLAHCGAENKNTCTVLPQIIKYYKNLGYEFRPITDTTPEYHFRISK
ncbi:peptidoglycan/xylan/chitin deacetylase (PgdA/CDA1 family) [Clostridium algifaecis]|uniref:Peptidoglycan/xylan/chitin deacetylase (PgdA/CDA1 family) n=1 Tax=Clostridium algifaecis TaxID=1472040 RepID=A0ABS4KUB1_9CLOT|nr:polysaccharide deacetylase family protein [Clostridium algifaecis]MBP2033634.1 peptidoglycan/xylan/chitin deacetylase (PgdA/CDA1 family) [Clostridium algifaecis]